MQSPIIFLFKKMVIDFTSKKLVTELILRIDDVIAGSGPSGGGAPQMPPGGGMPGGEMY